MKALFLSLLCLCLVACGSPSPQTPATFDLRPFSGEVIWSLNNPGISLSGTYHGLIGGFSGSGSLSMNGSFLMEKEPLLFNLSGYRSLSGQKIIINSSSGSVFFGARNQHNQTISQKKIPYKIPDSLQNIFSFLGDTNKPEATQKDKLWIYKYNTHSIHISGKKNISLYYYSQWSHQPLISCDTTPDMLRGKCLIEPPSRDAFISQPPLIFNRSTTLATNNTMIINN